MQGGRNWDVLESYSTTAIEHGHNGCGVIHDEALRDRATPSTLDSEAQLLIVFASLRLGMMERRECPRGQPQPLLWSLRAP